MFKLIAEIAPLLPTLFLTYTCWERRKFWHHRAYSTANYAMLSIAIGSICIAPTTDFIGDSIGIATGWWHLDFLIGLNALMFGFHALILHLLDAVSRLDQQVGEFANTLITTVVVIIWFSFFATEVHLAPGRVPPTGRSIIWGVFCTWLIVLCAYGIYYTCIICKITEGVEKCISCLYRAACIFGLLAAIHRVAELIVVRDGRIPAHALFIDHILRTLAIAALAVAASKGFRKLTKPLVIPDYMPPTGWGNTLA